MYNTKYYNSLPPAYSTKACVTQKPSHQHEGELPALPLTSCHCSKPLVCQHLPPPWSQAQGALTALGEAGESNFWARRISHKMWVWEEINHGFRLLRALFRRNHFPYLPPVCFIAVFVLTADLAKMEIMIYKHGRRGCRAKSCKLKVWCLRTL